MVPSALGGAIASTREMRMFVGVPLPPEVATAAFACLPELPGVRRVRPELMHVTLAFLGSVEEARLPEVVDAVREACRGRAPFELSLEGVGRFPAEGSPRIVWLGIVRGAPELIRLAEGLRAAIARRELPFDAKPFRAHVTLARVGDRADHATTRALASLVARARTPAFAFRAESVVCFESVVSSKGPRYTPRATVSLEVGEER